MHADSIFLSTTNLEHNSSQSNVYSDDSSQDSLPSFIHSNYSLKPANLFNINSDNTDDTILPIIITQFPVFASKTLLLNIWRKLIIDINVSSLYSNHHTTPFPSHPRFSNASIDPFNYNLNTKYDSIHQHSKHSMVVSLSTWDEMEKYNTINYATNVQTAGKIFIHFPIHSTQDINCQHGYVGKSICNTGNCGILVPFLDMRSITSMLNNYMNNQDCIGVLLHSHSDHNLIILFIGCCMIQGGTSIHEVIDIMKTLNLQPRYQAYIKEFDASLKFKSC